MSYQTIVGDGDLGMVLEALKEIGETKILSNPHVAVLNREEATIKVVTDQPYAEAQLEAGTTNVVGETIRFIEVGVSLAVTPEISDDGFIQVEIKPEVSSKIGDYNAFRTVPIIRKSYAETSVMVKDAETIIIAGMIENLKQRIEKSVPFLGRIPLLGILFRTTAERVDSSELIVFLTPRIITGDEPFLRMKDMKKRPKPLRPIGAERGRQVGLVR
jgi:type II secretory pathway component GspD/PulD (secretin)